MNNSKQNVTTMKTINHIYWRNAIAGVALCSILFSFSSFIGAHNVQVYLDDKLVVDHYVDSDTKTPRILVDPAEKYSRLMIKYNECGRTVTGRVVTLKNESNQVLKEWRFEGSSSGFDSPMQIPLKEITSLKQKGAETVNLFYSSNDFREGQQIASLVLGGGATTAAK
jgi:hypothetical protein